MVGCQPPLRVFKWTIACFRAASVCGFEMPTGSISNMYEAQMARLIFKSEAALEKAGVQYCQFDTP